MTVPAVGGRLAFTMAWGPGGGRVRQLLLDGRFVGDDGEEDSPTTAVVAAGCRFDWDARVGELQEADDGPVGALGGRREMASSLSRNSDTGVCGRCR